MVVWDVVNLVGGHVQVLVRQLVLEVVPVVVLAVAKEEYITNQNDNYIKT